MLESLSKKIAEKLLHNEIIDFDDFDIYLYGFQLAIATVIEILTILTISYILGWLKEAIIYLVIFAFLRLQAGGYHANTYFKCFLMTTMLTFTSILAIKNLSLFNNLFFIIFLLLISILFIFKYAPKDTPNKPLSEKEYEKYKKSSRVFILLLSIIMIALLVSGQIKEYVSVAVMATFTESLTLTPFILYKR